MNDFGYYLPPGVTSRMIDRLYRTELCRLCGYELDQDGDCAKCAHDDSVYDAEVDA